MSAVVLDPRLYLVTDTAQCAAAGRTVAETVAAAVDAGTGIVQVRDKDLSDADFEVLTRSVIEVLRKPDGCGLRVPLFVNDRLDVVAALNADPALTAAGVIVHVHVGQSDAPVTEVRRRLEAARPGSRPLVGLSAGSLAEVEAADPDLVDVLGLGPVFDTATKADAPAGLGVDALARLVNASMIPSVAIGGIEARNIAAVRASGVDGACVVSAICAAADPAEATRALLREWDSADSAATTGDRR